MYMIQKSKNNPTNQTTIVSISLSAQKTSVAQLPSSTTGPHTPKKPKNKLSHWFPQGPIPLPVSRWSSIAGPVPKTQLRGLSTKHN